MPISLMWSKSFYSSLDYTVLDYWEERANKVLSHFSYQFPDEIDMYDICWKYGVKIKPLDKHYFDGEIESGMKAFSIPQEKGRRGLIYLLPEMNPIEKKVVLAEEFCHIYAHHVSQVGAADAVIAKTEAQAKRMAAYLLMPSRFLKDVYEAAVEQTVLISDIADHFLVPEEFARYRLELIYNRRIDAFATIKKKLGSIEWLK